MAQKDDQDLFGTTRGKLLLLLCREPRTVSELTDELGVTDNAVRAQLAKLQQSGLVRQVGLRPGTRKPHVDYKLTPKARRLFTKAYEPALNVLIDILRERLPRKQAAGLLKEAAWRLLGGVAGGLREREPGRRLRELCRRLDGVTAGISVEERPDEVTVRACGCPLASVTAAHPEICKLLAEQLSEVLGAEVHERCDREDSPRCCFQLSRKDARNSAECAPVAQ